MSSPEEDEGTNRSFQCTVCPKAFPTASRLKIHTAYHSEERPYECKYCHKKFKTLSNHRDHERNHNLKSTRCKKCKKEVKFISDHMKKVHNVAKISKIHMKKVGKAAKMSKAQKNMIEAHKAKGSPYSCPLCNKEFATYGSHFRSHLVSHSEERPFGCNTCGKNFKRRSHLIEHLQTHDPLKKGLKPKGVAKRTSADQPADVAKHAPPEQQMMEPVNAINQWILEQEDGSAAEVKPFECNACHARFAQSDHLLIHKWNSFCEKTIQIGSHQPDTAFVPPLENSDDTTDEVDVQELKSDHAKVVFFVCKVCNHQFQSKGNLKRHQKLHSADKPFGCSLCDKTFVSFQTLQKHTLSHSKKPKTAKKLDRNRNLTEPEERPNEEAGKKSRRGGGLACKTCGKEFLLPILLKVHEQQHPEGKYHCQQCGKSFRLNRELVAHRESHNTTWDENTIEMDESQQLYEEDERYEMYPEANDSLTQVGGVADDLPPDEEHELMNASTSSSSAVSEHDQAKKQRKSSSTKKKTTECATCHKRFTSPGCLYQHMITHGEKKFHCMVCGKSFHYRHNLKEHERTHTGEKPYACHVCEQRFTQAHCLKDHVARQHEGEPFACRSCHEQFSSSRLLKQHQKIHQQAVVQQQQQQPLPVPSVPVVAMNMHQQVQVATQQAVLLVPMPVPVVPPVPVLPPVPVAPPVPVVPPVVARKKSVKKSIQEEVRLYSCKVCSNNYGSERQLVAHEKTHLAVNLTVRQATVEPEQEKKPFACDTCYKCFGTNGLLMQHKRTHGERKFTCSLCDAGFKFSHHLKTHMNTHSGTRPYPCTECEKRFTQIHVLRNHLLKEHGKMPYTCTTCDTSFPNLQSFKQHESETCSAENVTEDEPPVIVDPTFGQDETTYDEQVVEPQVIVVNLTTTDREEGGTEPGVRSKDQGSVEESEPVHETEQDQKLSEIDIKHETIETKEK